MFCHNCGKQIGDGVKFCRYCGASQAIINSVMSDSTPAADLSAQSSEYHYSYVKQQPAARPSAQSSEYHYSYVKQQPTARPQPQSEPRTYSQPVQMAPNPVLLASQSCSYKVAMESDFKKFEFGGMPEGTVEIYEDRLEFFHKSKMVRLTFGMIGSALSGKGKKDITIFSHMVRRETVTNQKNGFRFYLTDGRLALIYLGGISSKDAQSAMLRFLKI